MSADVIRSINTGRRTKRTGGMISNINAVEAIVEGAAPPAAKSSKAQSEQLCIECQPGVCEWILAPAKRKMATANHAKDKCMARFCMVLRRKITMRMLPLLDFRVKTYALQIYAVRSEKSREGGGGNSNTAYLPQLCIRTMNIRSTS